MKKRTVAALMASLLAGAALVGCGSSAGGENASQKATGTAEANGDTSQTDFKVFAAKSALSPGYDDNTVLASMEKDAGIGIQWETMSDSIEEQVNVRIAGGDLPDAFQGIGFSK
jgi:putative aldouronate transport system substrate-binding protein